MEIAKFLLLKFHPDISLGHNHVLALMFDMNKLWEQFIYISLKKHLKRDDAEIRVQGQISTDFWKHERGTITKVQPDILVKIDYKRNYIIDTKIIRVSTNNYRVGVILSQHIVSIIKIFCADTV